MLRNLVALLAAALLAGPARPVLAAVENSPHDLIVQGYHALRNSISQERCRLCHPATDASKPALLPEVPPSLRGRYGSSSLVCFSCHDGTTLVAPEVDASLTAFHPDSHGGDLTDYGALRVADTGLPHLDGALMECTTCHDPHDNSNRPMLRAPLDELCSQCHSPLSEISGDQGNRTGNHPVGADPTARPRAEVPLRMDGAFTVPFPNPYPIQKAKGTGGTHWNLGGHLHKGAAGALSCVTCHAVHGTEEEPPAPSLLAVDPVRDVADLFCEGCHRGTRGDGVVSDAAPNPGGTTVGRTYHPCDDDSSNGGGQIVETRSPPDWPLGGGDPRRLLCSTCHAPHQAQPGTALLRPPVIGASFCGECHDRLPLEYHHPWGEASGPCASQLPAAPEGEGGRIGCGICHRAHNAGMGAQDQREFVPILRAGLLSDGLCGTCHPAENPTCGPKTASQASHFLGDPVASDTYDDPDPPVRTEPWPESGLVSRFGGASGKGIVCLSCHSFRKGAVTSGDDGKAGFLVARSGNPVEWAHGEEGKYLCTGCHGVSPGTGLGQKGHTHPLMNADMVALGRAAQTPVTATPSGRLNCDSCHRPHEAVTAGGVYIMEAVNSANTDPRAIQPQIDFTPTCHKCHDPKQY